jgi:hypothetical protein
MKVEVAVKPGISEKVYCEAARESAKTGSSIRSERAERMKPDLERVMLETGLSKAEQAVFSILASSADAVVSKKELLAGL